jgi:hypothetical protein
MFTAEVLGGCTPPSSDASRSIVRARPCWIPRRIRGVIWPSENVVGSPPEIPPRFLLLSVCSRRRGEMLAEGPL